MLLKIARPAPAPIQVKNIREIACRTTRVRIDEHTEVATRGRWLCFWTAGREVRIMVEPKAVDDARALQLANDVARRVERELQYPGQIKVVVIRETRAMEYAK